MTGTLVVSNTATMGGGISMYGAAQITGITVVSNTAPYGGGIDILADVRMSGVTVISNTATYGGGIRNQGDLTIVSSTLMGNRTTSVVGSSGGAIRSDGNLTVTASAITDNWSLTGGGLRLVPGSNTRISDSQILRNIGSYGGGGITNEGTLSLVSSLVQDNQENFTGGVASGTPVMEA